MCEGGFPQITYSQTDLRAAVRIPAIQSSKTKCLEFRPPDAASNPYLAFAALLMAAIDGIQNKIHPGAALDPIPMGLQTIHRQLIHVCLRAWKPR